MSDRHYPTITDEMLWPFKLILQHLMEDPDCLSGPECPYSGEVKRFLIQFSRAPGTDALANAENAAGDTEQVDLEANIKRTFKELTDYGKSLGKGDTAEKSAYFRLSTTLLEKLVVLQERAVSVVRVNEFQSTVIRVLEEHAPVDVRTRLMDEIRKLV